MRVSVGTICAIVQRAGERARTWLSRQRSSSVRALALDEQLMHVWEAVAYLFRELHHLLDVVLLDRMAQGGPMPVSRRQEELETLVHLLFEVVQQAPGSLQQDLQGIARLVQLALPSLLHFAHRLQDTYHQAIQSLGGEAVHLIAWAWQRRELLAPDAETLLAGLAPEWRCVAQMLFES